MSKPTGYWRQEKDDQGRTTHIYELMDDGTEVETGYKHAYDEAGMGLPWWKTLCVCVVFVPLYLIATIWECWRFRK